MASQSPVPVMDYEGSRWRTEFWEGRGYEDAVERVALSKILPPHGQRLVEIGAGFGRLADLYRGYDCVILLDYARSMLEDAQARLGADPRFMFVAADLYNLPFADNALDTALTIRVLHHVADIPRAFGEVARAVRPGGTYITDFANKKHLKAILKYYLRPGSVSPFTLEPYEFVKLNFDYHPDYIRQQLQTAGFAVEAQLAVSTFRVGAVKRLIPASVLVALDSALQKPTAGLAIAPSIFSRAVSGKPGAARLNPELWRCPRCHAAPLRAGATEMACPECGTVVRQVEGIWDFKTELG